MADVLPALRQDAGFALKLCIWCMRWTFPEVCVFCSAFASLEKRFTVDCPSADTASVSGGPSHHSNTAFAQQSAATWLANVRTWHTRVTVPQGRVQHPGLC
ncbi:uncharacterized protein LOC119186019 isoform X2 [Rhipicephalus microplus]|uniref:uncharacterized protein LOC119186019 isoform X2 n=1 Tax=Rhipicephalus microplus TaxID=6941 RepID=UPI003F6AF941